MFDEVTMARFWSKVDKAAPNGCWVWTSAINPGGYGSFWINRNTQRAHRLSYMMANGPIPDGLVLDHLCRNKKCVNPAHLEAVTLGQNTVRGMAGVRGDALPTDKEFFCLRGHERTPENTYVRPNNVRECRECDRMRDRERVRVRKKRTGA